MYVKVYGYKKIFYDYIDKYCRKNVDCLNFFD